MPRVKKTSSTISLRLPEPLAEALRAAAAQDERSLNTFIVRALRERMGFADDSPPQKATRGPKEKA
jgi:predicted HicB family RNase H-like nuclease